MTNYVQPGETITLVAPYNVASGGGAMVGSIFGVANGTYLSGADGEFSIEGVFDLTKSTGSDFAQGDLVYWDNSDKKCVDTDSGNSYLIGAALATAGLSATTVRVRLNGKTVA